MSGSFNPYHQHHQPQQSPPLHHPIYDEFQQSSQAVPQSYIYGLPRDHAHVGSAPTIFPPDYNQHLPQHSIDLNNQYAEPQHISTADVANWVDQEAEPSPIEAKSGSKARRKPSGSEHVKHRRTRSGCYTCRQRRVKCDETHPICERCRKGQRECIYPDPNAKTKPAPGSKTGARAKPSMESLSEEDDDEEYDYPESPKGATPEVQESIKPQRPRTDPLSARAAARKASRSALNTGRSGSMSLDQKVEGSLSPSTEGSHALSTALNSGKLSNVSTNTSHDESPSSPFPKDQQFYLDYHKSHITYHHYQFKYDSNDFIHTDLLDQASHYTPLLFAVIGFASFQYTVNNPNGKVSDFLGYYTRAVSLFRKSLQTNKQHTHAMLMTILTLATFEEYLGDWVNLFGHQRAACEMLTELYDPVSVMQDDASRTVFSWYSRFDLFVNMMAGNEPMLPPEWFRYNVQWYAQTAQENPGDLKIKIENYFSAHRLMAVEMAMLNAKLPKGEIPVADYIREISQLRIRIQDAKSIIEEMRQFPEYQVININEMEPPSPEDIGEPYISGRLMKGILWPVNTMTIDWAAVDAMTIYQTSIVLQQPPPSGDLIRFAMEQIRVIQDIDRWSGTEPGALIPLQASLGLVCLFIPREERYIMWCRKQMAKLECHGYIFPASLRSKLAESWGEPSIEHWWLPDENSYPPVIRSIRAFIEERTMKPRSQVGEDIRAMKAMFSKFNIDDSTSNSPESAANTADHSGTSSTGGLQKLGSPSTDSNRDDHTHHSAFGSADMRSESQDSGYDVPPDWNAHQQQDPYAGYR